ncbi:prephenate dehydratase [Candidatus Kaiserbacteria bacterium CG10_big_fil_rev_8_21_14_0_10_59_10]|uniref:prephenate dehydratase n=1 Tax=Candidatus Kaiserbacteria bacterium CG10_big_fil_rev_8_21_14_0_10_59_10 TaxID=1974612 RepID=A0A2H0U7C8_9BACT|nr:MAG: prephenate dehydratase [Candidatus Kaiserbacteria bacterium CG10_big_fil_rev_8_21_14_0_10_59_10]
MKRAHVAYQGVPGAYSSIAARKAFPKLPARGYPTFEEVVAAAKRGSAAYALLPIENSTAGRVADIHHLLPGSKLHVVGEYFLPVRHCLVGLRGAKWKDIARVYSHREALSQCARYIRGLGAEPVPFGDTAGAVEHVVAAGSKSNAAIASAEAAALHTGSTILARNIQDSADNVTRFLIVTGKRPRRAPKERVITSVVYKVRDIPAALFKSLSGFATAGVNIIKLESFVPMARHADAHFYIEFEGNPSVYPASVAMEELGYYARELEILGTYAKSPYRRTFNGQ